MDPRPLRWAATAASPATGYGPDPSCQPCPDCGGLECLCRPRFFAGQLLTEQDLNRLEHYITEKHKLHNRHLFGSGVVCGLVVTCAPCDERVNVSAGYALSPCGEDIVVCKPDSVDICALIARCREPEGPDCRPYAPNDACNDITEEWVLAIRYAEMPSLPKTPMVGPSTCACGSSGCRGKGCACGGGCGCSPSSAAAATPAVKGQSPTLRRGAPPSCEPTVTCESYRYDVFRKPETIRKPGRDPVSGKDGSGPAGALIASLAGFFDKLEGEMAANIACCLHDLEAALPRPPGDFGQIGANDRQAWFRWCCAARSSLAAYFGRVGGTDCEAIQKLGGVACPSPSLPLADFIVALQQSVIAMLGLALEALLHCLCTNILPPCALPEDPRVPLAVVTIRKRDCHIIKVCDWTPLRRHVVTFPTLGYWFGWIPIRRIVRDFMEQLCCSQFSFNREPRPHADPQPNPAGVVTAASFMTDERSDTAEPFDAPVPLAVPLDPVVNPALLRALATSFSRPAQESTLTQRDLVDLVFRRPAFSTPDGLDARDQAALDIRIADSGLVKAVDALVRSAGAALPTGLNLASPAPAQTLRPDVAELRGVLDAQAREIAALKARLDAQDGGPTPAGTAPSGTTPADTRPAAATKQTRSGRSARSRKA